MASMPGEFHGNTIDETINHGAEEEFWPTPDSKRNSDDPGDDPWEAALEIGELRDKNMIESMKDDLNNLLVFTGLFSAVVTAFVVASYPQLSDSEDPEDATVRLLTQISLQLSSFTVTSGFVNSTAGISTPPPAHVDHSIVTVNKLWFASLTLSLIAAFFALTVQQWLRQFATTPRHLSTQYACRLRQSRYDDLMSWQVPNIIAYLSLPVQVAVALFLTGLLVLLEPLDHSVASTFAAIAGTAMILFILTTILPLVSSHCPYKSPFIPAIYVVLQWNTVAVIVILPLVLLVPFLVSVLLLGSLVVACFGTTGLGWCTSITYHFTTLYDKSMEFIIAFFSPMRNGMRNFWAVREMDALAGGSNGQDLLVLSSAIAAASGTRFSKLRKAVATLPFHHRRLCVLVTAAIVVESDPSIGNDLIEDPSSGHERLRWRITKVLRAKHSLLHNDHANLMMEVLPMDWSQIDVNGSEVTLFILLLLHLATFVNNKPSVPLFRAAITARQHQSSNVMTLLNFERCAPTLLICLQSVDEDCAKELTDLDANSMLSWAQENLDTTDWFFDFEQSGEVPNEDVHGGVEFILASTAAALKALTRQREPSILPTDHAEIRSLLSTFNNFVVSRKNAILVTIRRFMSNQEKYFLIVTPTAIEMICDSLARLAEKRYLPLDDDCPSETLVEHLYAICAGQKGDEYEAARNHLNEYRNSLLVRAEPDASNRSGEMGAGSDEPMPTRDPLPGNDDDDNSKKASDAGAGHADNRDSSDDDEKHVPDSADDNEAANTEDVPVLVREPDGGSGLESEAGNRGVGEPPGDSSQSGGHML